MSLDSAICTSANERVFSSNASRREDTERLDRLCNVALGYYSDRIMSTSTESNRSAESRTISGNRFSMGSCPPDQDAVMKEIVSPVQSIFAGRERKGQKYSQDERECIVATFKKLQALKPNLMPLEFLEIINSTSEGSYRLQKSVLYSWREWGESDHNYRRSQRVVIPELCQKFIIAPLQIQLMQRYNEGQVEYSPMLRRRIVQGYYNICRKIYLSSHRYAQAISNGPARIKADTMKRWPEYRTLLRTSSPQAAHGMQWGGSKPRSIPRLINRRCVKLRRSIE